MTDPLEDILKYIEKQTPIYHMYTHKEQFEKTQNGTCTSDTQQESMTTNPSDNISQMNRRVKHGQKNSVNSMLLTCNRNIEEPSQESDAHTRTRYGRFIQKSDRLTY